jgi:hypothetical protein
VPYLVIDRIGEPKEQPDTDQVIEDYFGIFVQSIGFLQTYMNIMTAQKRHRQSLQPFINLIGKALSYHPWN